MRVSSIFSTLSQHRTGAAPMVTVVNLHFVGWPSALARNAWIGCRTAIGWRWVCLASRWLRKLLPKVSLALTCESQKCWMTFGSLRTSNRHDNLAKMLGVPALPFAKVHKDLAAQMKRTIGYYVKGLLKMVNPTDGVTDALAAPPYSRPNLEVDSTGYPKVPTSVDLTRLSKVDMECLFRQFMSQHYCMCHMSPSVPHSTQYCW